MAVTTMWSTTLDNVDAAASEIGALSAQIEEDGDISQPVFDLLKQCGCFRMLVPRAHGGDGLSIQQALAVIERVSRADASVGWNVMIGSSNLVVVGAFPQETFDRVYQAGPDVMVVGSHAPKGTCTPAPGGYVINGRWPFVSGCRYADWIVTQGVVTDGDGARRKGIDGRPDMKLSLLPPDDVGILDTWHTSGLRGTGSHDVEVKDVYCPEERNCRWFGGTPSKSGGIFAVPPVAQLGLFMAAVALGTAQAALDDVTELASSGKRPAYGVRRLAESTLFQTDVGETHVKLRAARALLYSEAEAVWRKATGGGDFTLHDRAQMRATSSQVSAMCVEATTAAYRHGGGSAIYASSSLRRRFQDIQALGQHAGVGREFFTIMGALLSGEEPEVIRI
ncbi:acyl-CoA dehydrogenase family protein [Streptomyces sp. ME19-01-6]|uniref:acyl-CoA dehydrogenase family protein n=1 Tax=Streptomyces sp. ME19-01-6 TaxID=3028686 RepID=UPI0029B610F8|nr:acyl-CoA dehydrogenase family protein [Streptomyces sp. ME19-01-6]MDX3227400.1 acyl-CoA dehydrogenase family protein [Streptomyces sp. ME19-01-6]